MPTGPLIGIRLVVNAVLALNPRRIIDFGVGTGKWGFLIREQSDLADNRVDPSQWQLTIDGVEGYAPYIGAHQRSVYDEIFVADIREFASSFEGERYDVGLALDVIEHMPPDEGVEMVRNFLRIARYVFISTPKGFFPQEGHANELELHQSWWPTKALRQLATNCDAKSSVTQLRMANLAVLSCDEQPSPLSGERLRDSAAFFKDALIPERLYYRILKKTGPTILER